MDQSSGAERIDVSQRRRRDQADTQLGDGTWAGSHHGGPRLAGAATR